MHRHLSGFDSRLAPVLINRRDRGLRLLGLTGTINMGEGDGSSIALCGSHGFVTSSLQPVTWCRLVRRRGLKNLAGWLVPEIAKRLLASQPWRR